MSTDNGPIRSQKGHHAAAWVCRVPACTDARDRRQSGLIRWMRGRCPAKESSLRSVESPPVGYACRTAVCKQRDACTIVRRHTRAGRPEPGRLVSRTLIGRSHQMPIAPLASTQRKALTPSSWSGAAAMRCDTRATPCRPTSAPTLPKTRALQAPVTSSGPNHSNEFLKVLLL
jgi:hypothetical protein